MEKFNKSISIVLPLRVRSLVYTFFIGMLGFLILSRFYVGRYRLDAYLFGYPPVAWESIRLIFSIGAMVGYYFWDKARKDGYALFLQQKMNKPFSFRYHLLFFAIFSFLLWFSIVPRYFWNSHPFQSVAISISMILSTGLLYFLLFGSTGFNRSPVLRCAEFVLEKLSDIWFDIAIFSLGLVILIIAKNNILGGYSIMVDTNSQLTQARILTTGKWVVQNLYPVPDKILFNMGLHKQWLSAEYPPGYILFLALFAFFHVIQYTGPFMGALALPILHRVGHLVKNRITGRLAAIFLMTSPFWMVLSSEGMDHVLTLVLLLMLVGSLILLYRRRTVPWALLSGCVVSWTGATRPLNGMVYAFYALVILLCLRPYKKNLKLFAGFVMGTMPMALFLLFYNYQTTGSAWKLGFTAANPVWHRMGFNFNGVADYTPLMGLARTYASGISLNYWLFSWPVLGLLPVFLWWLKSRKSKIEWFLGFVIVVQIGAYFCYHFHDLFFGPRFWYETIGPILLLSACAITPLLEFSPDKEKKKKSDLKYAVTAMVLCALIFFTFYGLMYALPRRAQKYLDMKERAVFLQETFRGVTFPPHSILLLDKDYQDWIGIFGPPMSESLYYMDDKDIPQDLELKKQYPQWNYYRLDIDDGIWKKL